MTRRPPVGSSLPSCAALFVSFQLEESADPIALVTAYKKNRPPQPVSILGMMVICSKGCGWRMKPFRKCSVPVVLAESRQVLLVQHQRAA